MDQTTEGVLSEGHRRMLRDGSCISAEVIAARGYRTVTTPAELAELGFASAQRRTPALLLPLHTTDGQIGLYILRPDNPRTQQDKTGKTRILKYESPKDAGTRIDCPPVCQPMLGDPAIPLWVTEGQKKADALATQGLCAIALLGVWNWKTRNDAGGNVFSADMDYIAWKARDVRICFDSDVMMKTSVRQALDRLSEHLGRKGAHVSAVYLPNNANGGKLGVDDYLAQGHTVQELEALVAGPRPMPRAAAMSVKILDTIPETMRRPLQMVAGRAYAAAWLPCETTRTEKMMSSGEVLVLNPPEVVNEIRLFVLRDDGVVFGEGGDRPLEDLGFGVVLPEVPRPEKTMSSLAVKRYRAGYRADPLDVFRRVTEVVDHFIDFLRSLADQATMAQMVACYVLATWFLDALSVIGYLWPNGDRGTGKTQLLYAVTEMAHLGMLVLAGGSYASLRDMADYGAAIAFDDAENICDPKQTDPDKRALLLAGNRRGSWVSLKEKAVNDTWVTRYVNTFSPRMFSAIELPDPVLASRTIMVPLVRTGDRAKANSDPAMYDQWPHDHRALADDLWCMALAHLPEIARYEKEAGSGAEVEGRNLEPWRGILAVAKFLDASGGEGLYSRMEALSRSYQNERGQLETDDLTALVLQALVDLWENLGPCTTCTTCTTWVTNIGDTPVLRKQWAFKPSEVAAAVKEHLTAEERDATWVTNDKVGRVMGKLRFVRDKETRGKRLKFWVVREGDLTKLSTNYGVSWTRGISLLVTHEAQVTHEVQESVAAEIPPRTSQEAPVSDDGNKPDHACRVGPMHRTWWKRQAEVTWKCAICHPANSPFIETYTVPEGGDM